MKKVLMVDPPSGWKFGFPRPLPEEYKNSEKFYTWLEECGYPKKLIESFGENFFCRYWEEEVND